MLSFLRPLPPPRRTTHAQRTITYEDGHSTYKLHTPTSPFFSTQIHPVANLVPTSLTRTFFAPTPHYHITQSETFHVTSGAGLWYLWPPGSPPRRLVAGECITVPMGGWHTFENDPASKERLVVDWRYDEQDWVMEERFFRNFLGYLEDCRVAGREPSWWQVNVFCYDAWMPGAVGWGWCTGSERLNRWVSWGVCCGSAWVGRYLLGYGGSHGEYYRVGEAGKEG